MIIDINVMELVVATVPQHEDCAATSISTSNVLFDMYAIGDWRPVGRAAVTFALSQFAGGPAGGRRRGAHSIQLNLAVAGRGSMHAFQP